MFAKILFPTDLSDISLAALPYIKELKEAGTKEVVLLQVISNKSVESMRQGLALAGKEVAGFFNQILQTIEEEARQQLKPIEEELQASGLTVTSLVVTGIPQLRILEIAETEQVSAIILGSHGKSNLSSALLGSVSDHVIRHARQPVLVIKRR